MKSSQCRKWYIWNAWSHLSKVHLGWQLPSVTDWQLLSGFPNWQIFFTFSVRWEPSSCRCWVFLHVKSRFSAAWLWVSTMESAPFKSLVIARIQEWPWNILFLGCKQESKWYPPPHPTPPMHSFCYALGQLLLISVEILQKILSVDYAPFVHHSSTHVRKPHANMAVYAQTMSRAASWTYFNLFSMF